MSAIPAPVGDFEHRVQFYDATRDLADAVARFIGEGLRHGEPAVMIVTPEHHAAIEASLADGGIDVARAKRQGQLVVLDAESTLASFLTGDMPQWAHFAATIRPILQRVAPAGETVRAYGEMVDVLWQAGKERAAVALEQLWNRLQREHSFALLCGYKMEAVRSAADVHQICGEHTHIAPVVSPQATDVEALVAEVARRSESEAALRAARDDLQDFLENAAVAIHRVDRDGIIQWANRTELELLGYAAEEYIGHPITEFHVDRQVIDDILVRLQRGETIRDHEARLRHKDGTIRHVLISSNVQARHRETSRCFTRDITQRKRAEAEREAANRAKDEFLAVLGHELRNPLSPILTAVQLMRLRGDAASTREHDVIERQVKHLVHLVDDLLDVSRIARGKVQLSRRPIKLAPVVARAIESVSPLYEERHHALAVSIPQEDIWIDADETRICQVLANLLANAAKYTPEGGTVDVRVARNATGVRIAVVDNGIGIAPALLPTIFELFVQGPRTTERGRGGLGIGLAIVRELVALHGGRVTVSSDGPGRGSEFAVELPVIEALPATAPDADADLRRRVQVTSRRILVVDDNEDAGLLMGEMLRSVGHEVRVAIDGPRALEAVQHFKPDVALLDIGLPVMDGYELAAELRKRLGNSVRLMAVTGYGQQRDRERTRRAGFDAHFVKPIGLSKVLAALEVDAPRAQP